MGHYEIMKCNAQKFADSRNQPVWVCKAKRKNHYRIIFSPDQLTPNYDIYEEVKPNIQGDTHMIRKFTVDASKKVTAAHRSDKVLAAKEDEKLDPRMEQLDELHDRVEDDFDYVMTGIERLGRENMIDEALSLLNSLADTLDSAIGMIGGDFKDGESDITE